ncbi:hypothetical protein P167DRAFT_110491 [Morchella conica CCBAS932]|uniref:Uncharacterized protein n=1 Tax=Morchella conica CCBAS932 TaxID=1392247 RepID=A0A3N4KS50_9PEZI|nr:hypothetical protein P167DRAFT_110491 [Morchella conica CCBAS932]
MIRYAATPHPRPPIRSTISSPMHHHLPNQTPGTSATNRGPIESSIKPKAMVNDHDHSYTYTAKTRKIGYLRPGIIARVIG